VIKRKYSWGLDGFEREHISLENDVIVILCVLPNACIFDCFDLLDGFWNL
jgi:hypothetical protein